MYLSRYLVNDASLCLYFISLITFVKWKITVTSENLKRMVVMLDRAKEHKIDMKLNTIILYVIEQINFARLLIKEFANLIISLFSKDKSSWTDKRRKISAAI